MKKWFSMLLAASISLSSAAVLAADFEDITDSRYSWAAPAIEQMAELGFINGYEDGTFRPDNEVTRLEVLALFSRALGASNRINDAIVDMAVEKYGSVLEQYGLAWGTEEISFLLHRGVLNENDLEIYLAGDLKTEPMPRYEAAMIITKAMGGESDLLATEDVNLGYTDIKDIPKAALSYVKYVGDKGIMTGMDGNKFSPDTSVARSQMAVMLSRTYEASNYSFEKVKLLGVDISGRLISYSGADGRTAEAGYSKNVIMSVLGEPTTPKQMVVGVDAVITKSGRNVIFVDTLVETPDATITGKYVSRSTTGDVTSVTVYNNETDERETYPCAENISVTYNNAPGTLVNFKNNDSITLKLEAGEIVTIIGETRDSEIANAVVEDITLDPEFAITISHALEEFDGKVIPVDTNATVTKNGSMTDFSEIYPGDTVNLTLQYGVIKSVIATSARKNSEGVIQAVNISSRPYIEVKINNEVKTYYVTNDVLITINGEEGTLYDFRVGDNVKLTLEGQAVTKITTTSAQSVNGKIEGTVTSVNPSYGFVKVLYTTESGQSLEETVYCKDATTKVMTNMGSTKKIADIKVGQTVIATGTSSNGAFAAKVIVISSENN